MPKAIDGEFMTGQKEFDGVTRKAAAEIPHVGVHGGPQTVSDPCSAHTKVHRVHLVNGQIDHRCGNRRVKCRISADQPLRFLQNTRSKGKSRRMSRPPTSALDGESSNLTPLCEPTASQSAITARPPKPSCRLSYSRWPRRGSICPLFAMVICPSAFWHAASYAPMFFSVQRVPKAEAPWKSLTLTLGPPMQKQGKHGWACWLHVQSPNAWQTSTELALIICHRTEAKRLPCEASIVIFCYPLGSIVAQEWELPLIHGCTKPSDVLPSCIRRAPYLAILVFRGLFFKDKSRASVAELLNQKAMQESRVWKCSAST